MSSREQNHHEAGTILIESLVSLAIIGLVAIMFFGGLSTASKGDLTAQEISVAESAARSQLESVKSQTYINWVTGHADYTSISAPSGYSVQITVTPIDPATGAALASGVDNGVQKVTVTASFSGNNLTTLAGYKINRN